MTICRQIFEMVANSCKFGKAVTSIKQQMYEDVKHNYEDDDEAVKQYYEVKGEDVEHDYEDGEKGADNYNEKVHRER